MSRDLSALESKLVLHIGEPIVVVYDIRGPRMPATGIITSPKVRVSDDGLRASIPMEHHRSFDIVTRQPRFVEGPIPIDSIVRYMPQTMLDRLIRVGELDIRRLRNELVRTLSEGPGELVDIQAADKFGHAAIDRRSIDPLWQSAHQKSVAAFREVLKAEIIMVIGVLRTYRNR